MYQIFFIIKCSVFLYKEYVPLVFLKIPLNNGYFYFHMNKEEANTKDP